MFSFSVCTFSLLSRYRQILLHNLRTVRTFLGRDARWISAYFHLCLPSWTVWDPCHDSSWGLLHSECFTRALLLCAQREGLVHRYVGNKDKRLALFLWQHASTAVVTSPGLRGKHTACEWRSSLTRFPLWNPVRKTFSLTSLPFSNGTSAVSYNTSTSLYLCISDSSHK